MDLDSEKLQVSIEIVWDQVKKVKIRAEAVSKKRSEAKTFRIWRMT